MRLPHIRPVRAAVFDDPNLVSCAGLVPVMTLADQCGLAELSDKHLSVPTDKGAHAGAKVSALVAGMVAGADSIADMGLLRHGAMGTVFARPYAPSTLGSFLRAFCFGHVRQLDAVASRLLAGLHEHTPLLAGIDGPVMVDIDDTIIEVHGHAKGGSGYGYSGVRGLNALLATATGSPQGPTCTPAANSRTKWPRSVGDRPGSASGRINEYRYSAISRARSARDFFFCDIRRP